jgi:dTDP-4-amino-4,6-dideoxygalactose transaminase
MMNQPHFGMKKQRFIPITKPTLRPHASYVPAFKKVIGSNMLTMNVNGQEFEKKIASYLGVKYAVTVATCTSGLMLVMRGLGLRGEVIMPSFTFSASGLPLVWNNLKPVFADIDPSTYTLDIASVEKLITKNTSAIFATHVFGVPADVKKLEALARKHKLKLVFDAAHAFGSSKNSIRVGNFGDAEVFSLSPTKVLTAGEGGVVATNNAELAEFVRRGRNYGDDGLSESPFAGLSARMPELSAAIGLASLADLPKNLKRRNASAEYFKKQLLKVEPRLAFQQIPSGVYTTYKDLSIAIDPKVFGYTRDDLQVYFQTQGIVTRKYFYPALHAHATYAGAKKGSLKVTERLASQVLSLPLYSHISKEDIDYVVAVFKKFHDSKKS